MPLECINPDDLPIPEMYTQVVVAVDSQNDPASRERVQAWINSLWSTKDRTIAELLGQGVTR